MSLSFTELLFESAWKGSLLMLLGTLASLCLARRSATARRWVWFSTMLGLLLLPAAPSVLRACGWSLPVAIESTQVNSTPSSAGDLLLEGFPASKGSLTPAMRTDETGPLPSDVMVAGEISPASPTPASDLAGRAEPAPAPGQTGAFVSPAAWLIGLWFVGAALMLAPLVIGTLTLRRLEQTADDATGRTLGRIVSQVAEDLGIRRPVTTLLSDSRSIPMTWGVVRPRILLPREALSWPRPRLQMVLLHELTHVRRCDCVTLWIGQIARAAHWFNPLAWWGMHRLHAELENSCDDQVLASGTSPADYAEQLVEITAGLPRSAWAASVALAVGRTRRIHQRLEAILDENRNRRSLSRRAIKQVVACGLALTVGIGAIELRSVGAAVDSQVSVVESRVPPTARAEVELASTEPSPEVLTAASAATAEPAPTSQVVKPDQPPAGASSLTQKTVAEIQALIKSRYAKPADERALTESAISGMLKSLNDPYTEFMPPARLSEMHQALDGQLTGIGVQISLEEGRLTVLTALPDSPALEAGLRPGDTVLEVDGKTVEQLGLNPALIAIRGKAGTTVKLKLRRATGGEEEINVVRKSISPTSVQGIAISPAGKWQYWLDEDKKVGYVQITEFNSRTAEAFRSTVGALHGAGLKGLILDLRQCPGGLLNVALDVAKSLLPQGVIVSIRGQSEPEQVYRATGEGTLPQFPLLVIVNEYTASAAEVLSAALRENGRAVLLGTRTYGKGSVQGIFPVGDAGAIRMTTAYFYSPTGKVIDRQPEALTWGVDPNDGMFVPVSSERFEKWAKARKLRGVIDPSQAGKAPPRAYTPESLDTDFADPQLAAAMRSMTAKIQDGEFVRVGRSEVELQSQFVVREKLRRLQQQHDETLKQMQQLNKELQSVEK